jgi:TRAP-type transport system small permease protein
MNDKAANEKKVQNAASHSALETITIGARRILTPVTTYMAYIGSAVLGLLVLMLIYSIIARRLLDTPLKGNLVLTGLALGAITFLLLAFESLNGESMIVEFVIDRFPKKAKSVIGVIIHFISAAMLGVLCWQLVVQGTKVFSYHQTTATLAIPIYPFVFLAAFGILVLTLVYILHFIESLDKLSKLRRS